MAAAATPTATTPPTTDPAMISGWTFDDEGWVVVWLVPGDGGLVPLFPVAAIVATVERLGDVVVGLVPSDAS
jgi:hypothetical protein